MDEIGDALCASERAVRAKKSHKTRGGADSFESVRALRNTRRRARSNNHNGIIRCEKGKKKRDRKRERERAREWGKERDGVRRRRIAKERGKPKAGYRFAADSPLRVLLAPSLLRLQRCDSRKLVQSLLQGISRCSRLAP